MIHGGPIVPVDVTLSAAGDAPRDAVAHVVQAHLDALRIPGRPEVRVSAGHDWELRVNGRETRCPAREIAAVIRAVTRGRTFRLGETTPDEEGEIAAGLCTAALLSRLSVLLGPEQHRAVLHRAGVTGDLAVVLATVVDNGVALDDVALAEVANQSGTTPLEMAERLIDRGRADTLDVIMAPATLRRLTSGGGTSVFVRVREGIHDELGVLGPDFHLAMDPEMAEGTYGFTLNAVRTWLRHLPPEADLHNVGDSLADLLYRRAAWFVHIHVIEEMIDRLEVILPDTIQTIRARYPIEWLTAVARTAVDEGMSLRNLPTVLDRLLDLDPHPSVDAYRLREGSPPPVERGISDLPGPRDAVALIRQRLREEVARTMPLKDVPVRRLNPALEAHLDATVRAGTMGWQEAEEVTAEVRGTRSGVGLPLVAPSLPLRAWLRDVLRAEFPGLEVVALAEYPPALNVWTVEAGGG